MQLSKLKPKKEKKDKVLELGKKIETWVVNRKPELTKYLEFTNKSCDFAKQKTGLELPLVVAKVFVGVGNMIVKYHPKVLYVFVNVVTHNWEYYPCFGMRLVIYI